MLIGVLALQGAFREHIMTLEALGVSALAIRLPEQLAEADGLIIPGGESTTIAKLMSSYGFYESIRARHSAGMAVWGTCAGAILVAREIIDAAPDQQPLALLDISVRRNAYGRQAESFETDLRFAHVSGGPYRGVFIRAPWIERAGDEVEVLSEHDGVVVAVREGRTMATTFHPELTGDPRVHKFFLDSVVSP